MKALTKAYKMEECIIILTEEHFHERLSAHDTQTPLKVFYSTSQPSPTHADWL